MVSQKKKVSSHSTQILTENERGERLGEKGNTERRPRQKERKKKIFYPCGGKTTDFFGLKKAKQKPSLKSFSFLERERAKKCRFLQQN